MKELEDALIGNISSITNLLTKDNISEPDRSYFEGKLFAYEWSLEFLRRKQS